MKKLHKKIGAIVLASMIVVGGIASSGVKSNAVSSSKVKVQQRWIEKDDKFVQDLCKKLKIEILIRARGSSMMDKSVKNVFEGRYDIISVLSDGGKIFNRGEKQKFKNYLENYVKQLDKSHKGKQNKFLRVRFGSIGYILDFN